MRAKIAITFSLLLMLSCSTKSHELDRLLTQNDSLQTELENLNATIDDMRKIVIIDAESAKLKLGQEYNAMAFLVPIEKGYSPEIEFYVNVEGGWDTIRQIEGRDSDVAEFNFLPKDTGTYVMNGKFKQSFLGRHVEMPVQINFVVN